MRPSWASSCRYLSVKCLPEALRDEDEDDLEEEEEEQDHQGRVEVDSPSTVPGKTEAVRVPPGERPTQAEESHRDATQ